MAPKNWRQIYFWYRKHGENWRQTSRPRTSTPLRSPADCLIVYFSTEIYTLTSIFTLIDIVRWCCPIHWSKTRKVNITIHDINVGDCRTLWLRSYRVRGFEHYDQSIVDTLIFILNTILFHIITHTKIFFISQPLLCVCLP